MAKSAPRPSGPTICSPDYLAYAFAGMHRDRLRYVATRKLWMVWDGRRWHEDDTQVVPDLARDLCRGVGYAARKASDQDSAAAVIDRLGRVAAPVEVMRLAGTSRHVAARREQFDADANLLNTPGGIVDLRSGATGPHRLEAYLTRLTALSPAPEGTPCPAWWAWLERLTGGDAALQFFLQRAAGRALVKRQSAGAAPSPSLFIRTLARILGDDSATAALGECLALLPRPIARADRVHDADLEDRLEAEAPAILRWMIDGVQAWRTLGLAPPATLQPAVSAGSALDRWLDEETEPAPGVWASSTALYAAWALWATSSGEPVGTQKRLSLALAAAGFTAQRNGAGLHGFIGLKLRDASVEPVDASDPRPTAQAKRPSYPRPPQAGEGAERSDAGEGRLVASGNHDESTGNTAPGPHPPIAFGDGPLPLPPPAGEGLEASA